MVASGSSVGTAVVAFGVGAAVGRAFAGALARGAVGAAVVAFGVGAAVGSAFAAAACSRHVVIVECHDDSFLGLIMLLRCSRAKRCPNAVAEAISRAGQPRADPASRLRQKCE